MRRAVLILLCLLLLTVGVSAAGDEVTSLSAEVSVAADGTCAVTATAVLELSSAPREIVFPLASGARSISATGGSYDTDTVDGVKCVVFESNGGFTGRQTFVCTYQLPCRVEDLTQSQRFSLALPETGWAYPIAQYSLHIVFPYEVTAQPVWSSAYYNDVIDNYLNVKITDGEISAASVSGLKDRETLSVQLSFAPNTFDLRHLPGRTATADRLLFWLLLIAAVGYWFFRLRGGMLLPRRRQTLSTEATAGEIPCQLYGQSPDIAAMLAHWGNLGYLTIERDRRGRVLLRRRMEMGNERKPAERRLFSAIFRRGSVCCAQTLRFRTVVRDAGAPLRAAWVARIYQKNGGSPYVLRAMAGLAGLSIGVLTFDLRLPAVGSRWVFLPLLALLTAGLSLLVQLACAAIVRRRRLLWLLPGAVAAFVLLRFGSAAGCSGMMFLNLLLQAFCGLVTLFGGKRTAVGEELVVQLLGLRSFLRRADRESLQRLSRADGQYFYRMLPFAEQLGVGRAFVRRFGDQKPEACPWLTDARTVPGSAAEFYRLYSEIASAVRAEPYRPAAPSRTPAPVPRRRPHRVTEYDFEED